MALPKFRSSRRQAGRQDTSDGGVAHSDDTTASSDRTAVTPSPAAAYHPSVDLKKATKTRKHAVLLASICFFISVIFLILVCVASNFCGSHCINTRQTLIGNIRKLPVIRNTWFFKLDLTNIIPASIDGLSLMNSLARSLGLHDFYQVGLWGFCEGYNDEGITKCSSPKTLWWFNPVEIILNELLPGATVALPSDINDILRLIRIASNVMFGSFLTGVCMNFISIFVAPLAVYSRWWSFPIIIWTFIAALLTTLGAVIATVMFIIFRNVITSQAGLNIGASVGTQMFAFMWVSAAFSLFGFIIHLGLACCCASRRDVRTGRKRGSKAAYRADAGATDEKRPAPGKKFGLFGRKKPTGEFV